MNETGLGFVVELLDRLYIFVARQELACFLLRTSLTIHYIEFDFLT
jgi:hypothetical protein